jgi:hypothetical protein
MSPARLADPSRSAAASGDVSRRDLEASRAARADPRDASLRSWRSPRDGCTWCAGPIRPGCRRDRSVSGPVCLGHAGLALAQCLVEPSAELAAPLLLRSPLRLRCMRLLRCRSCPRWGPRRSPGCPGELARVGEAACPGLTRAGGALATRQRTGRHPARPHARTAGGRTGAGSPSVLPFGALSAGAAAGSAPAGCPSVRTLMPPGDP